jgi:GNAT superfamily N-acetyltransferase
LLAHRLRVMSDPPARKKPAGRLAESPRPWHVCAMTSPISTRSATAADVPVLLQLIRELADYEKLSHEVVATEATLQETLFGARRSAEALIGCVAGEPAGMAIFFHNYSTFLAQPGLYLEDLYVRPAHRGCGLGKALITAVARIAAERGCGRYEWTVLDWNTPAIEFYQSLGAEMKGDWRIMRVTGAALTRMAAHPGSPPASAATVPGCDGSPP